MSDEILVVLVTFIEGFLHYFTRRDVLGWDLPKPAAYVLGTLGMMGPFTAWLVERNYIDIAWMLWWVMAAGGSSVLLWYLVDWVRGLVISLRESREREAAALDGMREAVDAKR